MGWSIARSSAPFPIYRNRRTTAHNIFANSATRRWFPPYLAGKQWAVLSFPDLLAKSIFVIADMAYMRTTPCLMIELEK